MGLGIQPFASNNPPANNEHIVPEVRISNDVLPTPANVPPPVQSNGPYPNDFQDIINNPNSVLQNHIAGQDILGSITIEMTTTPLNPAVGLGVSQIPFLGVADNNGTSYLASTENNCFVLSAAATFWIEWVKAPSLPYNYPASGGDNGPCRDLDPYLGQPAFLQLQYSQTVILVFNGVFWPHVTVATMHLSNG